MDPSVKIWRSFLSFLKNHDDVERPFENSPIYSYKDCQFIILLIGGMAIKEILRKEGRKFNDTSDVFDNTTDILVIGDQCDVSELVSQYVKESFEDKKLEFLSNMAMTYHKYTDRKEKVDVNISVAINDMIINYLKENEDEASKFRNSDYVKISLIQKLYDLRNYYSGKVQASISNLSYPDQCMIIKRVATLLDYEYDISLSNEDVVHGLIRIVEENGLYKSFTEQYKSHLEELNQIRILTSDSLQDKYFNHLLRIYLKQPISLEDKYPVPALEFEINDLEGKKV